LFSFSFLLARLALRRCGGVRQALAPPLSEPESNSRLLGFTSQVLFCLFVQTDWFRAPEGHYAHSNPAAFCLRGGKVLHKAAEM
jgi:hypothetical protein